MEWKQNITRALAEFKPVMRPGFDGVPVLCIDKQGMRNYAGTIPDPDHRAWAFLSISEQ